MKNLIGANEAAAMLGITVRQINRLAKKGVLVARYPSGKKLNAPQMFRAEEVAAYAELREKHTSLTELAAIAQQAHVSARALERSVDRLMDVITARIPIPSLNEDGILSIYEQVRAALANDGIPSTEEVLAWAKLFYGIGEEYFELVAKHTGSDEPWKPYLNLASKLCKEAPQHGFDAELDEAYGYLAMSRRFLRQAAYFYIRNKYGKRVSDKMFPETSDSIVSGVVALAFADQP